MYKTKVVNGATVPDTNYICYYKGTLSGTTLSNLTLVWSSTGSDQTFALGDTVDLSYTSGWGEDLYSALSTHLDQDGTLKADSVDVTAVIKDAIITNAKLVNDTITEAKTNTKPSEFLSDFIASGGAVAQSAGLVGTFSNIVYYIGGVRYAATSVANKTYTASKDTYVDIGTDGTVDYNEVANGAASPALSANHIRVAKVVTNGSAITSVTQNGVDSLGNKIYNLASDIKRTFPLLSRQGGSATDWSVVGTTNYDTRGIGVFVQSGKIYSNASPKTITFPVPFSAPPLVVAQVSSVNSTQCFVIAYGETTTGFNCQLYDHTGATNSNQDVTWMAIGI